VLTTPFLAGLRGTGSGPRASRRQPTSRRARSEGRVKGPDAEAPLVNYPHALHCSRSHRGGGRPGWSGASGPTPIRSRRGGGGAAYRSPADSGPTAGSGRLVETPPKTMPAGLFDDVDPALRHRSLTPAISPGPESSSDQGADSFNFLCDGPRWRTAAMGEGRETEATG
jgi:hypothetical protein